MEQYTPPELSLAKQIKAMSPETTIVVEYLPTSVKPIISRLKKKMRRGVRFRTAKHSRGTQIWRDK